MKKSVKFIILGLVVIAVAGGAVYSLTAPLTTPLTQVVSGPAELSFTEQGQVVAEDVVQVYPAAQGQLLRVSVTEGQSVRAGDLLCELDTDALQLQRSQLASVSESYEAQIANLDAEQEKTYADLRTSRKSLQGELAALEAQEQTSNLTQSMQDVSVNEQLRLQNIMIEQSEKELARANEAFTRAEVLYGAGSMPRTDYDDARDAVASCESALEAARQQLLVIGSGRAVSSEDYYRGTKESLRAQIAGIDQSLAKDYTAAMKDYYRALIQGNEASLAQLDYQIMNCGVTAPVDGVVTQLAAKSTNYVSPAAPVAEITVPGGHTVEVFVSTKDIDSVHPGDSVDLTLKRREGDAVFTGEVAQIETSAEVQLSALGVEERKVKVKIAPHTGELTGASFGIGYSVDVKFYVYRADNKLTVPKTALFKDDNGADQLWVVRNGVAEAIAVSKGLELRTDTVIESGLVSGDFVVTDANNKELKNGVKIKGE